MSEAVAQLSSGPIAHLRIDDGNRNVLTLEIVEALHDLISGAAEDSGTKCLILEGNANALSVGLDTRTVLSGSRDANRLLGKMGAVLHLLYLSRLRSIVITAGHATAAGAMLLLVADYRIGYGSGGKIGLSEVGVGLEVPAATQQLVRDRLGTDHQYAATALARLYEFPEALQAGYLDALTESREDALRLAQERGAVLANLAEDAYLGTKRGMRQAYRALVA